MYITNSPDITDFSIEVIWDISIAAPVIRLTNLSSGTGLSNCIWWWIIKSPSQTLIHDGSELNPDITGNWNSYLETAVWPRPFGQIEWSGAPYNLIAYVKDSVGNVYSIENPATICRPVGNLPTSKNTFGLADVNVQIKCEQGRVFFQDQTYHSYKGLEGTIGSSNLQVMYPIDQTGTIPDPFQINNFSTALVPITYSSDNYQFLAQSVYDYDFGDNIFVRIKYQVLKRFAVWCNINLAPLACEIQRLVDDIESGNCTDIAAAQHKLTLINPKFALVIIGQLQPLTGIDVPGLIEQIKEIGGFECNCCEVPTGIIPDNTSVIDGYTFSIVSGCGDISGSVQATGTNIQFTLSDVTYVMAMYPGSPQDTSAFTIVPSIDGCTKTYYLRVDGTQLAEDILNIIKNDGNLVNLFNSIVVGGGGTGSGELIVDGGCIFDSTSTCDYDLTLSNIPASSTFALLSNIKIGSNNYPLSYSFNQTNLGGLQTYLNGLGYGTFVVTNLGGGSVGITSTNNANDIQSLSYKISGTTYLANLTKDCTGYVPISANQVVQNIINYLCGIDDSQIVTSQSYEICYLDATGTKQTQTVTADTPLADFIAELVEKGCTTIDYIKNVKPVTCENLKEVFVTNNLQVTSTDTILGTKGGGVCSQVTYLDAFRYMLTAGVSNSTVKQLFCDFVSSCVTGLSCAPFDYTTLLVSTYDTSCTSIVGIDYMLQ